MGYDEEMIHGEHEDDVEVKATMRMSKDKITPEIKELACIICTDNSCSRNSKFAFVPNDHLALCSDSLCIARRAKKWMVKAGYRKIDPEVAELKSKIAVLEERIQGYEGVLTAIKQGDRQGEVKLFKFNGRYYAAYIVVA